MFPIVLVSATRHNEKDFYTKSALGRSISQTYSSFPIRSKIYFNNSRPLAACYNEVISSEDDPGNVVVFLHDDVFLVDFYWIDKLQWGFQHFDILGVAGNKRRVPKQPNWAFIDDKFTWDQLSNLSGLVGHGNQFPCQLNGYGPPGQSCKLLDGVLLSAQKSTLKKHGIQFDERFDFHFYDLDFCRQAEAHGLRAGTVPLGIIHESHGNCGSPQWRANYERYLAKWRE